jgi:hypothetical protein
MPMTHILKGFPVALALIALTSMATPASAISADLAKKCRAMAIKSHPSILPGAKTGNAQAERIFYKQCIANGGAAPDNDTPKIAAPPSK